MSHWKTMTVLSAALMASTALAQTTPDGPPPRRPEGPVARQRAEAEGQLRTAQDAVSRTRSDVFYWNRDDGRGVVAPFYYVEGKTEKAAFLGVSGSPVMPALREQLKLPRGVGLVVEHVEPKSPAEAAGIKQYDVLHKIGDQLLVNAHQLAVLVRMHKPGEEVTLTLLRQGESKDVKVKLTEKEVMALDDQSPWGAPPGPWQNPAGADVLIHRDPAGRAEGRVQVRVGHPGVPVLERIPFIQDLFVNRGELSSHMKWSDDQHEMELKVRGKNRHLTVKDKSGKTLFDDAIDTPEQRERLSPEIREKLKRLESMPRPGQPTTQPMPPVPGFGRPTVIRLETDDEVAEPSPLRR
jgi:hypothetical protein